MKLPFRMLWIVVLSFHLAGCNVPLGSYPHFWEYTKAKPRDEDLVGTYQLLKLRLPSDLERTVREKDPIITLRADHTVVFTEVPKFDGFGQKLVCRLSGPQIGRSMKGLTAAGAGLLHFRTIILCRSHSLVSATTKTPYGAFWC